MSVLSYLESRAAGAILSPSEDSSIATSVAAIRSRITLHFGSSVSDQFRFGSSTRGTILPRTMDEASDIDYMIVFKDDGSTPQTHLDRVRRFAEKYYYSSDIKQSSPSIVLDLNHIKFDLVPAQKSFFGFKIVGNGNTWIETNPNDFNRQLTDKNNAELSKIKPTIRLAKFWNAKNGYVYDSFSLEKWIVSRSFFGCLNQSQYLFRVFDELSPYEETQWRRDRIERAKAIVRRVRDFEAQGMPISAEAEVKSLIPA